VLALQLIVNFGLTSFSVTHGAPAALTAWATGSPSQSKLKSLLKLMDLGVEDVEEGEQEIEVYVGTDQFEEMKKKIAEAGLTVLKSELVFKPTTLVPVSEAKVAAKVLALLEKLDAHDDVLKVYANFDIPDDILAQAKSIVP